VARLRTNPNPREKNKPLFLSKWASRISDQCHPRTDARSSVRMYDGARLLWIEDRIPVAGRDSGSVRLLELLSYLVKRKYSVRFYPAAIGPHEYRDDVRGRAVLQNMGVEVLPTQEHFAASLHAILAECDAYQAIVVGRRTIFMMFDEFLTKYCPKVPVVYDTVDVHFLREARQVMLRHQTSDTDVASGGITSFLVNMTATGGSANEIAALRRSMNAELALMRRSTAVIVVSHIEYALLLKPPCSIPAPKLHVVTNVHNPAVSAASAHLRHGLLFVGNMEHVPNIDAFEMLASNISERVYMGLGNQERLRYGIHVVSAAGNEGTGKFSWAHGAKWNKYMRYHGRLSDADLINLLKIVRAKWNKYMRYHGRLSDADLINLLKIVRVSVAPLRYGAGVKGKVGLAKQHGLPSVVTSLAAEGMNLTDGVDCLVRDDMAEFAAAVVMVYTNETLWKRISANSLVVAKAVFGTDVVGSKLTSALRSCSIEERPTSCDRKPPVFPVLPMEPLSQRLLSCYGEKYDDLKHLRNDAHSLRAHYFESGIREGRRMSCN
jgi:O-antigen biosynthesis protein